MSDCGPHLFEQPYIILLYDELSEYEEAISYLSEHLRSNPSNGIAYNNRALAHYEIGENVEAADDFSSAIKYAGQHPTVLRNWGRYLEDEGKLEAAITSYREATRQAPDDPTLHRSLAHALVKARRSDEAIFSFSQAIRIDRRFPRTYFDRAAAYAARGATFRAWRDRLVGRVLQLTGEPARSWRKEAKRVNARNLAAESKSSSRTARGRQA